MLLRRALTLLVLLGVAPASAWAEPSALEEYETGRRLQVEGDQHGAVEHFKRSLQINPSFVGPMIGLAQSFHELALYDEALRYVLEARRHDRNNLELLNLEGRIRIALGELDAARALFEQVLAREPHNRGARLGVAQLDLARGEKRQAALKYREILEIAPRDVEALLQLALIYEDLGEEETAARYLDEALRFHSYDPRVYYTAGRSYARRREYETAVEHLRIALDLRPAYPEARQLLGEVLLLQGKPAETVALLRENLAMRRTDDVRRALYAMGVAYGQMGSVGEALELLGRALRESPDDEAVRLTAESLALRYFGESASRRARYARYRVEEGGRQESRSYLSKALAEYRRAVELDTSSEEARFALAGIYRVLGLPLKYLGELIVLRDYYGSGRTEVLDDIELLEGRLLESVGARWADRVPEIRGSEGRIDPYNIKKGTYSVALATVPRESSVVHPTAEGVFTGYLRFLLLRSPRFLADDAAEGQDRFASESFEAAYARARDEQKSDFFVLVSYQETDRTFRVDARLHLTRTGSLLRAFSVFRTGNRKVQEALLRLAAEIEESFPPSGSLRAREFDTGLIDLGTADGVREGDEFLVVRRGAVDYRSDALGGSDRIGFRYRQEDVVGRFVVTAADEAVAEGVLEPSTFFDRINVGDAIIPAPVPPSS